jgi:hypothetical protein
MRIKQLTTALLAVAAVGASLPATAASEWDLLGVKLGMTEAEVRAAFQAYDPKAKVIAVKASLPYSDGINNYRTEPFLDELLIETVRTARFQPLRVWFSGPVGEPRVIAIGRTEMNTPNPPTQVQLLGALYAKYGQPNGQLGFGSDSNPLWQQDGKPACIYTRYSPDRPTLYDFPQVLTGQMKMSQVVNKFMGSATREMHNPPADPSQCGAVMYYSLGPEPVRTFYAGAFDLGALAATAKSRQELVEKLQAEARAKRESQGAVPQL